MSQNTSDINTCTPAKTNTQKYKENSLWSHLYYPNNLSLKDIHEKDFYYTQWQ